jgi:hypothetical protein
VSALAVPPSRGQRISLAIVSGLVVVLAASVGLGAAPNVVAPVVAVVGFLAVSHRTVLAWKNLVALLLLVVLFIPMRRYALPGGLPFQLDPFRLLVAFVLVGWIASLLTDPATRLRRTGLGAPLVLVVVATIASDLANGNRVSAVGSDVGKNLTFFLASFAIVLIVVSVTVTREQVDGLIKVLVGGGAVVAAFAILESRTHFNVFDHLSTFLPFLQQQSVEGISDPSRGYRTYASAQHPIALSAMLVLIAPISIYLVRRTHERRWWLAASLLFAGTISTISRTSILMLLAVVATLVVLRAKEMRRMWPALIPMLFVVHVAMPGTLGTLKQSFFPSGGIVSQQSGAVGTTGQGRLADVGPALDRWYADPLFGEGYATRVIGSPGVDGQILDDQWLGTLVETGVLGVFAWLWLILRVIRRLGRAAREDRSDNGWLLTALTASIVSFAVGMFFYDTFAFIQVTVVFFVLLAFASMLTFRHDRAPATT